MRRHCAVVPVLLALVLLEGVEPKKAKRKRKKSVAAAVQPSGQSNSGVSPSLHYTRMDDHELFEKFSAATSTMQELHGDRDTEAWEQSNIEKRPADVAKMMGGLRDVLAIAEVIKQRPGLKAKVDERLPNVLKKLEYFGGNKATLGQLGPLVDMVGGDPTPHASTPNPPPGASGIPQLKD